MKDQKLESPSLGTGDCTQNSITPALSVSCCRKSYSFGFQLTVALLIALGPNLGGMMGNDPSNSWLNSWLNSWGAVNATTLLQTPLSRISVHAELIFEGTVIKQSSQLSSRHSQDSNASDLPYTYFTFEINELIKGSYTGKQIVLGFAGGKANGQTTVISNLHMPAAGEHGVYFVESLDQKLLNPLFGWHQGHYIVQKQGHQLNVSPLLQTLSRNQNPLAPQALRANTSLKAFKNNIRHQYHSPISR